MGTYNPSAPVVLGEEWVGIRDEDVTFSPGVALVEIGHRFTLTQSRTLADARFYIQDWPPATADDQTFMAAVYPAGLEDQSGPVQRVVIPCNNGGITGASSSLVNATTFPAAVFSPADDKYATGFIGGSSVALRANVFFAVNSFAAQLSGKRILGVNVLYGVATLAYLLPLIDRPTFRIGLTNNIGNLVLYGVGDGNNQLGNLALDINTTGPVTAQRLSLGSHNPFWSGTLSPVNTPERMPWTYPDLQRLEASATNRYAVYINGDTEGDITAESAINYVALEVFYCEEKRVAVGGKAFGDPTVGTQFQNYVLATNSMTMRDLAGTANPVLAAGEYTLTMTLEDSGFFTPAGYPTLNGLRELQAMAPHEGFAVTRPFPYDDRAVGKEITIEELHVLPQLSLHTSGGPLTEVHVYGRQAPAPVYGSITATQEILDAAAGGTLSWPQVRFYARRFGDTSQPLLLDSPSIAGSSVSIDPVTFDDLEELVDGWREVTLRFTTAPSMGAGTNPQWRFSAAGETSGNQWQVLGLTAPALSGTPGDLYGSVPTAQMLSTATYGAPSAGSTINLGWMYPMVSSTTEDATSDAVLLFSQDPPTPTNFAVDLGEQELSVVDPDCPEFAASCVPSILYFNQLTWDAASGAAYDDFEVAASNGWGTAPVGGAWTTTATASDFNVSNGTGNMLLSTTTSRRAVIGPNVTDMDVSATFIFPAAASGGDLGGDIIMRYTDSNNTYLGRLIGTTTGTVTAGIDRRVAAAQSTVATAVTLPFTHTAGTRVRMRMQAVGTTLRFKAWIEGTEEPPWTVEGTDTSFTTGMVGVRGIVGTGNLNIPITVSWDDFQAAPFGFGAYEIDRYDPVDGEFFTIMAATDATTNTFNDYEARVGQPSVYRIRQTNLYDFAGLWSPQVTGTVTSPGVVGADTSLLLFTTNVRQDGSSNLAYSAAWEGGQPVEDYQWPEASTVVLQDMFSKDYPTAFRPLERGGERFARQLLINAAGVPPATTARGFENLRNMAWDTVPYICVRNEEGDRWYSTVIVPGGSVRRMIALGRLCMAAVQVIETTDTPYAVNP